MHYSPNVKQNFGIIISLCIPRTWHLLDIMASGIINQFVDVKSLCTDIRQ